MGVPEQSDLASYFDDEAFQPPYDSLSDDRGVSSDTGLCVEGETSADADRIHNGDGRGNTPLNLHDNAANHQLEDETPLPDSVHSLQNNEMQGEWELSAKPSPDRVGDRNAPSIESNNAAGSLLGDEFTLSDSAHDFLECESNASFASTSRSHMLEDAAGPLGPIDSPLEDEIPSSRPTNEAFTNSRANWNSSMDIHAGDKGKGVNKHQVLVPKEVSLPRPLAYVSLTR